MSDVIIIGGGPGGYAAGIRAAQLGGKVTLIEAADIGGTCVNRGCIPTKVWHRAAFFKQAISAAAEFGITARIDQVDLSVVAARKTGVSGDIRMGMNGLLKNNKIEVINGRGVIRNPGQVEVQGRILKAGQIIIAAGTSPTVPDIPGLPDALMTTDELFDMTDAPASVLVYGSGHIEVEMASLLNAFGVKVWLAFEDARILPVEDGDTSQRIGSALRSQGVEIIPRARLESVNRANEGFEAVLAGKEPRTLKVEKVLVATRTPNTQNLGLDQAGVSVNDQGFIQVNEQLRTSADNIYAIGDVTGGWMFSYAATAMGVVAAENAMGSSGVFAANLVPRGLYTFPEAAAVGLSEEEAEEQGYEVETGVFPMSINGLAMAYGQLDGAVKIVSEAKYGEILGVHIVGGRATELIWGAGLAMRLEATAEDLARTIVVHPTFSESMAMAAQDALGWALYLPKR